MTTNMREAAPEIMRDGAKGGGALEVPRGAALSGRAPEQFRVAAPSGGAPAQRRVAAPSGGAPAQRREATSSGEGIKSEVGGNTTGAKVFSVIGPDIEILPSVAGSLSFAVQEGWQVRVAAGPEAKPRIVVVAIRADSLNSTGAVSVQDAEILRVVRDAVSKVVLYLVKSGAPGNSSTTEGSLASKDEGDSHVSGKANFPPWNQWEGIPVVVSDEQLEGQVSAWLQAESTEESAHAEDDLEPGAHIQPHQDIPQPHEYSAAATQLEKRQDIPDLHRHSAAATQPEKRQNIPDLHRHSAAATQPEKRQNIPQPHDHSAAASQTEKRRSPHNQVNKPAGNSALWNSWILLEEKQRRDWLSSVVQKRRLDAEKIIGESYRAAVGEWKKNPDPSMMDSLVEYYTDYINAELPVGAGYIDSPLPEMELPQNQWREKFLIFALSLSCALGVSRVIFAPWAGAGESFVVFGGLALGLVGGLVVAVIRHRVWKSNTVLRGGLEALSVVRQRWNEQVLYELANLQDRDVRRLRSGGLRLRALKTAEKSARDARDVSEGSRYGRVF